MSSDRMRRLPDRLPVLLERNSLAGWIVFTRESSSDPVAAEVGAGAAVARTALLFGRMNGSFRRVALCASYDVSPLRATGIYEEVIGYGQEGVRPHLAEWVSRIGPGKIGIDVSRDIPVADGLSAGMRAYLEEAVGPDVAGRFTSAEQLVADLVGERTDEEIAHIREAVLRTQRVLREALTTAHVKAGKTTERDLEATLRKMVAATGDSVEFVSINAGPTRGHSDPTDRVIAPGDLLRIDFGIRHNGFCSDVQRTAYLLAPGETSPPEAITRMWNVTREAFEACVRAIRPGATGLDADTAARNVIERAGYRGYTHAAGHPVGARVHDVGPILGPDWPERYGSSVRLSIRERHVFAVEPMVYAPDPRTNEEIHIGLEDDVVVGPDGARILGEGQLELWIIPS